MNYRFWTLITVGLLAYALYNLLLGLTPLASIAGCAIALVTLFLLALDKAAEQKENKGNEDETHLE